MIYAEQKYPLHSCIDHRYRILISVGFFILALKIVNVNARFFEFFWPYNCPVI